MSEIPADIQKIAEEIVIYGPTEDRGVTYSLITKAILAERERCAAVARDNGGDHDWPGEAWIATRIADQILSGTSGVTGPFSAPDDGRAEPPSVIALEARLRAEIENAYREGWGDRLALINGYNVNNGWEYSNARLRARAGREDEK